MKIKPQPHYVVPLLIEQPTWGGEYIAKFKSITEQIGLKTKIGQSYELAKNSILLSRKALTLPFLLAQATDLAHPQWRGPQAETINIQALTKISLLNKFTQAQENSYQTHVRPGYEFGQWQAKPESWYYFEPGKATLGLKNGVNVEKYHQRCKKIYQKATQLSEKVKQKQLSTALARTKLLAFINQDHPSNYVNIVWPQKNQVVDLSSCGIHHSWEADPKLSLGNIVYEVQLDQRDEVSSLRSFDQGKIKTDGSLRELMIEEYFKALNTSQAANQPKQYMQVANSYQENAATITQVFNNPHYQLVQIEFMGNYQGKQTQLKEDFHHLFVKEGKVEIVYAGESWPLNKGWSIFIPKECKKYQLNSKQSAQVLKTTP